MTYDLFGTPQQVSTARNTLSVDGAMYLRLLDKLDESGSKGKPSAKRIYRRLGYEQPKLCIRIECDGHNSTPLVVAARNLSQGGISILHSNFMYNGTTLSVDLINTKGEIVMKHGTVTRCEHRGGRVHEIGIKFDDEISLRDFLSPSADNLLHARERIDPETMTIKLLVFTEDSEFSAMMRQHLMPSSLCYTFAKTKEEAFSKFEDQDMLFFHVDKDSMDTPELVRQMRDKGFKNPIVLAGHPTNPIDIHVVSACGADMLLPWPCDEQTVLCSIAEYTTNEWTPESLENIRGCVSPETRQILTSELVRLGIVLDQQIRTKNQKAVQDSLVRIRMMAPLLGLESMKLTIDKVTEQVGEEGKLEELADEISEIASICTSLNKVAA